MSDVANHTRFPKLSSAIAAPLPSYTVDPKAILFDLNRNLLVLPVDLYVLANASLVVRGDPGIVPPKLDSTPSVASTPTITWFEQYPQFVWQGAYIFKVSVSGGIEIQGNVSQLDNANALLADPSLAAQSSYQWINYDQFITRSLYIGNTLYTLSDTAVQLNSLSDFSLIAKVPLQ